MKHRALIAGVMLAVASPAFAQTATPLTDTQFVEAAAMSNMFEIESSRLALQKTKNADTKTFAQKMIDDHTKAGTELKAVAAKVGDAKIPAMLDAEHKKLIDDLNAETGDDFDEEYIDAQVDAHEKAVALFTDYAKSGKQSDLKAFAQKTLPTLKMHNDHVQKMD